MWNLLGVAVCAEADCDIGSSTALCLAAAACDRAGSLDSKSIIISPFKSSAFLRDYAQQWNLTSSTAGDSLRVCSFLPPRFSLPSFCLSLSPAYFLSSLWSPCLPFPSPPPASAQGFGREPATSLKQIFPGSPKAILPGFPLGPYPLPMFQIIYRIIYLFYVVMDSFDKALCNETLLLTRTSPQLIHFLYFLHMLCFHLLR